MQKSLPWSPHAPYERYLQTHYTRFVLKTVQFIGASGACSLAYPALSAALIFYYYLKEPVRRGQK